MQLLGPCTLEHDELITTPQFIEDRPDLTRKKIKSIKS